MKSSLYQLQWYQDNKTRIKEYREANKEKLLARRRELYRLNHQRERERAAKAYQKFIDVRTSDRRKKYQENREKECLKSRYRQSAYLEGWKGTIPELTQCQCCGRDITFCSGNNQTGIHFDHRNGGSEMISGSPTRWLQTHSCNPSNKAIWDSCDFGMLCLQCNTSLPTVNRKLFLQNAVKYVGGI